MAIAAFQKWVDNAVVIVKRANVGSMKYKPSHERKGVTVGPTQYNPATKSIE